MPTSIPSKISFNFSELGNGSKSKTPPMLPSFTVSSLTKPIDFSLLSDQPKRTLNETTEEQEKRLAEQAIQTELAKAQAKRTSRPYSLHEHIKRYWPIVEPAYAFIDNWHIGAISEHLTAVTDGEIRNLIVNIPPGCMKSLLVDVFWPTWEWTWMPWLKYLFGSYDKDLAVRDSKKCRRMIESDRYREEHGDVFSILSGSDRQDMFQNDQSGIRVAASTGGGHGWRFDRAISDDALSPKTADSRAEQQAAGLWWFEIVPNRAQDPKTMANIIVEQRLATKDLTGQTVARELGYELLCLPMRYESKYAMKPTKIGFTDPRTVEGQLLFEERFPEEAVKNLEKTNGVFGTAAQLQQRPIPRGGETKLFLRPRFESNIRTSAPIGLTLVRYWDKAFTAGGGAYTVGVLMGKTKTDDYWILDVRRGQWGYLLSDEEIAERVKNGERLIGYRDQQILNAAAEDKRKYGKVKIWLEHEPGDQGKTSCERLIKLLQGYIVDDDPVKQNKEIRAHSYSSQQQAGNVYLLQASWNEAFIQEHEAFPEGEFKDQVDAASGAFNKLVIAHSSMGHFNPIIKQKVKV